MGKQKISQEVWKKSGKTKTADLKILEDGEESDFPNYSVKLDQLLSQKEDYSRYLSI